MDDRDYLSVVKRVGRALVVFGLLDIGLMIYCIVEGLSYHSSFNIIAVVAGIFLIRGSPRAAGIVLWLATLILVGFGCLVVLWPAFLPPGLALAELRLYPLWFAGSLALEAAVLGFLYWVARQLLLGPVLPVRMWGFTAHSLRSAVVAGVGLVAMLALVTGFTSRGQRASRAIETAAAQLGPGYKYHLNSIHWLSASGRGTEVSAIVTAWNDREIRKVPINWQEK